MANDLSVAIERLRTSTQRLNAICDEAAQTIKDVEAFLEESRVGVTASVFIRNGAYSPDADSPDWVDQLEYRRLDSGKFRIAIVRSDVTHPPGPDEVRAWSECTRDEKLDSFEKLPRRSRYGLVAAVLLLGGVLGRGLLSGPSLPESLRERAVYVADAFSQNDGSRLRTITAPGGDRALESWLQRARPQSWNGRPGKVRFQIHIEKQDKRARKAIVLAYIITGGASGLSSGRRVALQEQSALATGVRSSAGGSGPVPVVTLKLHWVYREERWMLDGAKTLAALAS